MAWSLPTSLTGLLEAIRPSSVRRAPVIIHRHLHHPHRRNHRRRIALRRRRLRPPSFTCSVRRGTCIPSVRTSPVAGGGWPWSCRWLLSLDWWVLLLSGDFNGVRMLKFCGKLNKLINFCKRHFLFLVGDSKWQRQVSITIELSSY